MTGEEGGGRWRTGGNGEDDTKGDMSGKGPYNNNTSIPDPPPPRLKAERQGGSRMKPQSLI
jgi:hypothetical protein